MKEELKPYYIEIHNLLGDYNNIVYFVDQSDRPIFESVLKAAFAKCIEFNYYILNKIGQDHISYCLHCEA